MYNTTQTREGTLDVLSEQHEIINDIAQALAEGRDSQAAIMLECMVDVLTIEIEMVHNNWAGAPIQDAAYSAKLKALGEE